MADTVTPQARSQMMSRIRGRDTKAELAVRRALHARGYRYRVNDRRLAGSPDIVLHRYRAVVFVHGCFWHRHRGCSKTYNPKSRVEFWRAKFEENIRRDEWNILALSEAKWRVAVVWECAVGKKLQSDLVDRLEEFLKSDERFLELAS